ncbi:MAG: DsbE family thiol:disulfide interchange protein [Steroidobacteraceae bacterium]|jgi:cytochrome c biogenesis protein CcmG/thiol:disulfide interchange protein DsbE|nr:DsbE family thiol:disulfide interchange protein [Steroidobacteraceae bacterium]
MLKLKFIVPLLLFVALGIFLFVGLYRDPRYVPSPLIGKPAPEFTLPSLQDANYPVSSKELLGQPWVLNVWGTWCGGCRQEHDTLLAIAAQRAVPLVGLNWKDDNGLAQQWLAQLGNPYAVIAEDREGRTAIDWGVYGAPETFLIGPDGIVLYKHIAPMTMEVWQKEFLPRIEAARAATGSRT